ncbi:MAG: organomercurial lyase [Gammaproteobacteria bacterium]|nr:organomercurial lyase [Gammaproteobacteria bacterium]
MQNTEQKISAAVVRLNQILPLAARHRALDPSLQKLHRATLQAYIELGRSLTRHEMAQQVDDIDAAVDILKHNDLVVFDDHGNPIGAYPFSMQAREHRVTVNGHTVHCMCALDALAVSPMFRLATTISSRCHVTRSPITIRQWAHGGLDQASADDLYVGINWGAASSDSCCADSLCLEMIFLKHEVAANRWLKQAADQRQIFAIHEALEFASRFFMPLIHD